MSDRCDFCPADTPPPGLLFVDVVHSCGQHDEAERNRKAALTEEALALLRHTRAFLLRLAPVPYTDKPTERDRLLKRYDAFLARADSEAGG